MDGLSAAITPNARIAYCAVGRNRIGVFALPSGRYLRSFVPRFADPDAGRLEVVPWQFDPAGRLVLIAFDPGPHGAPWTNQFPPLPPDERLGLLDVSSERLAAQTRLGDIEGPTASAWTRDGQTLALGTSDGTLGLYSANSLRLQTTAGIVASGPIRTVAFAPDDRTLALGAENLSLWSVPGLTREGAPIQIGDSAGGLWAWYASSRAVVGLATDVAKPDAGMRRFIFRAQPGDLAKLACRIAGTDITRRQWQRYAGDQPYRHICP